MNKWIEKNKKEFGVQILELQNIIERQVKDTGNSDQFTSDMLVAIKTGRKITSKMESAIDRIIKVNSPDEMLKRQEWVDKVVPKLMMVSNMITETNWKPSYRGDTHRFINSIIEQAKSRKTLSKKQMESVNKVYLKIKKNIEKNKKKT